MSKRFWNFCAVAVCVMAVGNVAVSADDLKPTLGERGSLLLEETFEKDQLPDGWTKNTGSLTVSKGLLRVSEVASDKHAAAFRYRLPVQDCAVQFDFQFEGAKMMNFGYDPAPGELKKKGHLFSVVITPESWSLIEHLDKADPNSKNQVHAKSAMKLESGKRYTLLVECRGDQVVAQIAGHEPLKATSKNFHVKKPGLVFRAGGSDDSAVLIDNVRVWELKSVRSPAAAVSKSK